MIPVEPKPEPDTFNEIVRIPGNDFLKRVPQPTPEQWHSHAFWKDVLNDLADLYNHICAYSAHWIPTDTGARTVDHFIPKTENPGKAYEWSNYRYASLICNSRKGVKRVQDPFRLKKDSFVLDFPSLKMKVNKDFPPREKKLLQDTIDILGLNGPPVDKGRESWIKEFCSREISFNHLKNKAPFIAYELERQDLIEKIVEIMGYDCDSKGEKKP